MDDAAATTTEAPATDAAAAAPAEAPAATGQEG